MKKIIIGYWHLTKFNDLPYEHNQEFEYTVDMVNIIVMLLITKGYSVMLRPTEENLYIWIDKGKFGQR